MFGFLKHSSHFPDSVSFHPTIRPLFFLQSFQKEITLNTERIDGLIVFGEGLIQKSSPQDAALIEDELEELHTYCQEVFSRLVRFHQRLSQPPVSWSTHTHFRCFHFMSSFMQIFQRRKYSFYYSSIDFCISQMHFHLLFYRC